MEGALSSFSLRQPSPPAGKRKKKTFSHNTPRPLRNFLCCVSSSYTTVWTFLSSPRFRKCFSTEFFQLSTVDVVQRPAIRLSADYVSAPDKCRSTSRLKQIPLVFVFFCKINRRIGRQNKASSRGGPFEPIIRAVVCWRKIKKYTHKSVPRENRVRVGVRNFSSHIKRKQGELSVFGCVCNGGEMRVK